MITASFRNLLEYVETVSGKECVDITLKENHWHMSVQDLKNLLSTVLFEVPNLRKRLDWALKDVETLQEQIAGETLAFEPPRWEYDFFFTNSELSLVNVLLPRLNQKGREGWEVIYINFKEGRVVFKRPKGAFDER